MFSETINIGSWDATGNIGDCDITGYFHDWYYKFNDSRTRIKYVVILKNDMRSHEDWELKAAADELRAALSQDFAEIVKEHGPLTVCGVPRAKAESSYAYRQTGLKRSIRKVVESMPELSDGLDYIVRVKNTCTTHRSRSGHGGDGEMPRPGLIRDTCRLSPEIRGKDILLVDDIYTPSVGIDEDALCTLIDCGARSVVFYAVGYTVRKGSREVGWNDFGNLPF